MVWILGTLGAVVGISLEDFLFNSTEGQASLVGASGAVAALIGAHIASVILNWTEDSFAMVNTIRLCGKEIPFPATAKAIYRYGIQKGRTCN